MSFDTTEFTDFFPDKSRSVKVGVVILDFMGIVFGKTAVKAFGNIRCECCFNSTEGTAAEFRISVYNGIKMPAVPRCDIADITLILTYHLILIERNFAFNLPPLHPTDLYQNLGLRHISQANNPLLQNDQIFL